MSYYIADEIGDSQMEYQRNKKYRITLEGRVAGHGPGSQIALVSTSADHMLRTTHIHPDSIVSSEEISPPLPDNWPPQPGDLWADDTGTHWFCRAVTQTGWRLVPERGDQSPLTSASHPSWVLEAPGLQLVLRKTPDGSHMTLYYLSRFDSRMTRVPQAKEGTP